MNSAVLGPPVEFPSLPLAGVMGNWPIRIALLASVVIHGVALGWLPGISVRPDTSQSRQVQVRLVAPIEARPVAVAPAPTFSPPAQAVRHDPLPTATREAPILTRPGPEAAGEFTVRRDDPAPPVAVPPEAPRAIPAPVPPRAAAIDAGALAAYGRELAGAVASHQRYPRAALMRQWQGTAVLQLELAADGRLLGVRVISSSGHDLLDRQALDMVRDSVPLPSLPATLAGRPLTVDVPVVFRIAS